MLYCTFCCLLQSTALADSNSITFVVKMSNLCTNKTAESVPLKGSTVKFYITDPHNWTNITVVAKSQCNRTVVQLPVSGINNSTGKTVHSCTEVCAQSYSSTNYGMFYTISINNNIILLLLQILVIINIKLVSSIHPLLAVLR